MIQQPERVLPILLGLAQLGGWAFLAGEGAVTPSALAALVALGALHLAVCYLAIQQRLAPRSGFWFLLLVALAVRLAATGIPVTYSNDLFRYRWEGRWQTFGGNPYRTAPNDAEARRREPPGEERVPGRDFRAVYGPLLLLNERIAYQVTGENIGWWRAPAALADLGALALLAWWIRLKSWPRERLLIYAASPLPVLEFWSSGHHDAWIVLLIAAALVAHARQSWGWMMTALGLAALTKYWPLMLVPLFAAREGRRWRWAAVIPALALAAFAPFGITALETNARFATGFVGGWRNNDFLFGSILAATGDLYQAKYLAFAIVAVTLLALWWRNGEVEPNALLAVAALLVVSANIHPWYGTWLLPFLIAAPRPPILAWIALFPVFYETVIEYQRTGVWEGVRPSRWLVHGTFAILVLIFAVLPSTLTLKKRHN